MAWQQRNLDLTEQALTRMWRFQVAAARIEGKEPPEKPPDPETYFGGGEGESRGVDRPWPPFDPSPVPRKPMPSSGAGEVALPLPENGDEEI